MQAHADLPKQNGPGRIQLDCNCDERQKWGAERYHQERQRNVKHLLRLAPAQGTQIRSHG